MNNIDVMRRALESRELRELFEEIVRNYEAQIMMLRSAAKAFGSPEDNQREDERVKTQMVELEQRLRNPK
jgi:hypothetical protein